MMMQQKPPKCDVCNKLGHDWSCHHLVDPTRKGIPVTYAEIDEIRRSRKEQST